VLLPLVSVFSHDNTVVERRDVRYGRVRGKEVHNRHTMQLTGLGALTLHESGLAKIDIQDEAQAVAGKL
jgi:hypothetical protein